MAFNLKPVLTALLFSSSRPLSIKDIQAVFTRYHDQETIPPAAELPGLEAPVADAMPPPDSASPEAEASGVAPAPAAPAADVPALVTAAQIREATAEIARELQAADDVFLLAETAHGFRLVTRPQFAAWVRALRDEPAPVKLSPSAMETLAVIAYRQPVTRAEIEHIRGVSAEAGINKLLERELIYIVGRADLPGRPIQYGTTDAFLEYVGMRSVEELPATDVLSREQINDWLQNAMRATHPSDRDMGLEEEGEEQLSLADAARTAAAQAGPAPERETPPAGGDGAAASSDGPADEVSAEPSPPA